MVWKNLRILMVSMGSLLLESTLTIGEVIYCIVKGMVIMGVAFVCWSGLIL